MHETWTAYAGAVRTVEDLFGTERFSEMEQPLMGSEDMSYVLQEVPGAYVFVKRLLPGGLRQGARQPIRPARRSTTSWSPTPRPGWPRWPVVGWPTG